MPDDLPWRKQMRSSAECLLRENDSDLLITYIDCKTDCPDVSDIPEYLLERFAYPDIRSGYRASSGLTIYKYILQNNVLKNRVIWLKGMDKRQIGEWYTFCRNYQPSTRYDGLFVIEAYDDVPFTSATNIGQIQYHEFVSYNDALLFNSMVASSTSCSTEWKQYMAVVSSLLCNCDVELSQLIIRETDFTKIEPIESLKNIAATSYFERRRQASNLDASHPFSLLRCGKFDVLSTQLWKAQLQTLFSLIELERIAFIDKYKAEIEEALATQFWDNKKGRAYRVTQAGEYITDAYDAEIGTLYRLNHLRKVGDLSCYLFFLPNENDRNYLSLLHDIRNSLAHIETCPVEKVYQLLSHYPYSW